MSGLSVFGSDTTYSLLDQFLLRFVSESTNDLKAMSEDMLGKTKKGDSQELLRKAEAYAERIRTWADKLDKELEPVRRVVVAHEEPEEKEERDSFVASDSEEPSYWSEEEMQRRIEEDAKKTSQRKRAPKKREFFDPTPEKLEEPGISLLGEKNTHTRSDKAAAKSFLKSVREDSPDKIVQHAFFVNKFGDQLREVKANLGYEGRNKTSRKLLDTVISECLSGNAYCVDIFDEDWSHMDTKCALCNSSKKCCMTVSFNDGAVYPLGSCCGKILEAIYKLFEQIYVHAHNTPRDVGKMLDTWDALFEAVLSGNANKKHKK